MQKEVQPSSLFVEFDLCPHTTSIRTATNVGGQVYYELYNVQCHWYFKKSFNPCKLLFWRNEHTLIILYVYFVNPLLYRAGRAWKRSTLSKRRQLREPLAMNYLSICLQATLLYQVARVSLEALEFNNNVVVHGTGQAASEKYIKKDGNFCELFCI